MGGNLARSLRIRISYASPGNKVSLCFSDTDGEPRKSRVRKWLSKRFIEKKKTCLLQLELEYKYILIFVGISSKFCSSFIKSFRLIYNLDYIKKEIWFSWKIFQSSTFWIFWSFILKLSQENKKPFYFGYRDVRAKGIIWFLFDLNRNFLRNLSSLLISDPLSIRAQINRPRENFASRNFFRRFSAV